MAPLDSTFDPLSFTERELAIIARSDKRLYAEITGRIEQVEINKERKECEDSLIAFFERAWREIDAADFSRNWHHEIICEYLEAITWQIDKPHHLRNLVINVPPRMSKSLLANICWPAWVWTQPPERKGPLSGPHVTFLCVSYGATLAQEHALLMRRLVMGEWYSRLWGHRVRIFDDQQSRENFATTAGGGRISTSVESGILGRGGEIILVDDPINPQQAESTVEREKANRLISEGLATRVKNPRHAARVMLMQRLHQSDPTTLALDLWKPAPAHVMIPMRFEANRCIPEDPRIHEGELLWPAVWNEQSVAATEVQLGDFAIAAQFQQSPIPRGGGIIDKDDWAIWPEFIPTVDDMATLPNGRRFVELPDVSHVILSLDTALSEKETADWNAFVVWGVWSRPRHLTKIVGQADNTQLDDGEQPRAIMMGAWRGRCKLNDDRLARDGLPEGLVQRVAANARRFAVDRIIIENKTRGLDVKNELERQFRDEAYRIEMFEPRKHGDKVARVHAVQPLFSQGLVYAPANCVLVTDENGRQDVDVQEFAWAKLVMDEISQVPKGGHDDLADAAVQGLLTLRDQGFLSLTKEYLSMQIARRMHQPRRQTVARSYGV